MIFYRNAMNDLNKNPQKMLAEEIKNIEGFPEKVNIYILKLIE